MLRPRQSLIVDKVQSSFNGACKSTRDWSALLIKMIFTFQMAEKEYIRKRGVGQAACAPYKIYSSKVKHNINLITHIPLKSLKTYSC